MPSTARCIRTSPTPPTPFFLPHTNCVTASHQRYTPTQLLGVRGANFSISDDWPESFKVQGGGILDRAYGAGCAVKHPGSAEKYGAPHMVQPSMEQVPPGAVAAPTANVPIESGASAGGYLPYTIDPSESLGPDPAMSKS